MATPITQQDRLLKLHTHLGEDILLIDSFTGIESISRPFRFDLKLMADVLVGNQGKVVAEDLIEKSMAIEVELKDGKKRFLTGLVTQFTMEGLDNRFAYYHAVLVSWFTLLDYGTNCRIFQDKSIPQIIDQVIEERGMKSYYRSDLARSYTSWDYCVQYNESDFAFLSRIMEAEGIYYFFEHKDDRSHTLVVADRPDAHKPCPEESEFRFDPDVGIGEFEDTISVWKTQVAFLSGAWTFRDYHLEMPRNPLEVTEPGMYASGDAAHLKVYHYPGEYAKKFNAPESRVGDVRPEGEKLVRVATETAEKNRTVVEGASQARAMANGFTFKVTGGAALQIKGEYLLTSIRHSALQNPAYHDTERMGEGYSNQFSCISSKVQFRPARITAKPIICGPQTAFVIDENPEPTEEIWPDKYGRVRVRFPWDRDAEYACWIRVVQQWAGKGWGYQWIPRVGDEVMVAFLHGDPDCPIIVGSVYNHDNMPPFKLPDNKTQSGIKTRSSPKGSTDNFNMLRFEDKKGSEEVYIHAERNLKTVVENHEDRNVGESRLTTIYQDDKETVQQGNHELTVSMGDRKATISMGNDSLDVSLGNVTHKAPIGTYKVQAMQVEVDGTVSIKLSCGASSIEMNPAMIKITAPMVLINS
jgi:type VI secretion system secreted protein VgrG